MDRYGYRSPARIPCPVLAGNLHEWEHIAGESLAAPLRSRLEPHPRADYSPGCGQKCGQSQREEPSGETKCFSSYRARGANRSDHKDPAAEIQHTGSSSPGRLRALLLCKEPLNLDLWSLNFLGELKGEKRNWQAFPGAGTRAAGEVEPLLTAACLLSPESLAVLPWPLPANCPVLRTGITCLSLAKQLATSSRPHACSSISGAGPRGPGRDGEPGSRERCLELSRWQ